MSLTPFELKLDDIWLEEMKLTLNSICIGGTMEFQKMPEFEKKDLQGFFNSFDRGSRAANLDHKEQNDDFLFFGKENKSDFNSYWGDQFMNSHLHVLKFTCNWFTKI